jgi:hypothetical protein
MTKTLRPVFTPPEAAAVVDPAPVEVDDGVELEEQAASVDATPIRRASHVARLSFIS